MTNGAHDDRMSHGESTVRTEAAARKWQEEKRRFHANFDQADRDLESFERWERRLTWGGLLVTLPLAGIGLVILVMGLWTGTISTIAKYQGNSFSRAADPLLYWLSVGGWVVLSGLFLVLSVQLIRRGLGAPLRRHRARS